LARDSLWSGGSRTLRPAQDEEIAQLEQTRAQPLAFVPRELRERSGEQRDLIRFETHEDLALGRIARGRQKRGGRDAERLAETGEHGGAWLFDAPGLELGDRAARHTDLLRELALCETKTFAIRAYQPCERGSGSESARRHVRKLTACRHRDSHAHVFDSILSHCSTR